MIRIIPNVLQKDIISIKWLHEMQIYKKSEAYDSRFFSLVK